MFALLASIAKICVHATKVATKSFYSQQIKGDCGQNAGFVLPCKSFLPLISVIYTLRGQSPFIKALSLMKELPLSVEASDSETPIL
jgi:hypothetical protein